MVMRLQFVMSCSRSVTGVKKNVSKPSTQCWCSVESLSFSVFIIITSYNLYVCLMTINKEGVFKYCVVCSCVNLDGEILPSSGQTAE